MTDGEHFEEIARLAEFIESWNQNKASHPMESTIHKSY